MAQQPTDRSNGNNRHSREAFLFEDPNVNGAQPNRIIPVHIVRACGIHDGSANGGAVWQRMQNLKRRDLFGLAAYTEKPATGLPPLSMELQGLIFEDILKMGRAVMMHNDLDYPGNIYSCCCCS